MGSLPVSRRLIDVIPADVIPTVWFERFITPLTDCRYPIDCPAKPIVGFVHVNGTQRIRPRRHVRRGTRMVDTEAGFTRSDGYLAAWAAPCIFTMSTSADRIAMTCSSSTLRSAGEIS